MKDADSLLSPGSHVGGYRIEYKLGAGGMGAVYAAVEPTIGRRVAVKVLRSDLASADNSARRFEREARSVSLVRHPAIVDVFSFGKLEDGRPYFVMPLYEGRTLRELIAQRGQVEPAEAWRICREIAEGLAAAHKAGVLHRDLKPDNIMVADIPGRKAQPVLLDFGLAKWLDQSAEDVPDEDKVKLTGTGVPLGTPIYMAPEQWWSSPMSAATDQYAFGVMLFEMLAGHPPFRAQKFPELLQQHLHETPPKLGSLGVAVSSEIDTFITRLLEKKEGDRFASFAEVIERGDAAFSSAPLESAEPARAAPPPISGKVESEAIGAAKTELVALARSVPDGERSLPAVAPAPSAPATSADPRPYSLSTLGPYAASIAGTLGVFVAIGYAGVERWNVPEWVHMSGYGAILSLAGFLIVALVLPRLNARRALQPALVTVAQLIAIFPAAAAMFGTYGGWEIVKTGVAKLEDPSQSLYILHAGRYEIGALEFMGFGTAAALALGLLALFASPRRPARAGATSIWLWVAGATLLAAPALLALRCPSPVFTVVVAAAAIGWLSGAVKSPSSLAPEMGVAALSATLAARAVSQVRADVHAATAWSEPPTRAERIVAMVDAARDRSATSVATTIVILLVVGAAGHAYVQARDAGLLDSKSASRRRMMALAQLASVLVLFGFSIALDRSFEERRARLVASMREQLVLYAKLSPPIVESRSLPPPVQSPALQITSDSVALNGRGIGKMSALDSESGRQAMAAAIIAALAEPSASGDHRQVDLSLLVDRSVPWSRVEELLGIAYEGGARFVDFLLTRGAEPTLPDGAPEEVAILLPRDFGATSVKLAPQGEALEADTFETVSKTLLERAPAAGSPPYELQVRKARR